MFLSLNGRPYLETIFPKKPDASKFLAFVRRKRDEDVFNDVIISEEEEEFPANKLILSYHSRFFEEKFSNESEEENYILQFNYSKAVMKILLEYFYNDSITIKTDNVCDLLLAAHELQIDDVQGFCFQFLESVIACSNCLDIYGIANHYKNTHLKDLAFEYLEKNFKEVARCPEFNNVKLNDLSSCLPKLNDGQTLKLVIYEAIVSWTKHAIDVRSKHFPELLWLLDLERLPSSRLLDVVQKENLFQEVTISTKLSNKIYSICLERVKKGKTTFTKILSLGGKKTETEVFNIFQFKNKDSEVTYPDLPEGRCGGCSVASNNTVLYFGGKDAAGRAHSDVWRMKMQQNELRWKKGDSMKEERALMACAIFHECLIVVGGTSGKGKRVLSSCEQYNELREWQDISPLKERRSGHALVVCEDALYAFGGCDGKSVLSSVERLPTIDGEWKNVCSMKTPRHYFTVANCNDVIYAIGGSDGENERKSLKSAEKYDVKRDRWIYVSEMNHARRGCSSCVLHERIFVIGGVDADGNAVKQIEFYDPIIDTWNIAGETEKELVLCSVIAV